MSTEPRVISFLQNCLQQPCPTIAAPKQLEAVIFTVVTYRRQPLLIHPESRQILREVIQRVWQQYPFVIDAWMLLPDHTHCVWTLPSGDSDYSKRWSLIKAGFSKRTGELFKREN